MPTSLPGGFGANALDYDARDDGYTLTAAAHDTTYTVRVRNRLDGDAAVDPARLTGPLRRVTTTADGTMGWTDQVAAVTVTAAGPVGHTELGLRTEEQVGGQQGCQRRSRAHVVAILNTVGIAAVPVLLAGSEVGTPASWACSGSRRSPRSPTRRKPAVGSHADSMPTTQDDADSRDEEHVGGGGAGAGVPDPGGQDPVPG